MKKVLNVILGLAFIVIIVSGWVFGISAYRRVNNLEFAIRLRSSY